MAVLNSQDGQVHSREDVKIDVVKFHRTETDQSQSVDSSFTSRNSLETPNSSSTTIQDCENSRNVLLDSSNVKEDNKRKWWKTNVLSGDEGLVTNLLLIVFLVANFGYLLYTLYYDITKSATLLVIWILAVLSITVRKTKNSAGFKSFCDNCSELIPSVPFNQLLFLKIAAIFTAISFTVWILYDTRHRLHQLIPLGGYILFVSLLYCFSKHRLTITWRPVVGGILLQLCMALIIMRSSFGFVVFTWLSDKAQLFLSFVDEGSKFVFGPEYAKHYFAFRVLPIIIYFSSFISVMYHLGVVQSLILKISWVMYHTLGTSATESMVAAGNIFIGQTESPLLIQPYIKDLTLSEMHAVMTAGFGTIAGSVFGAYLGFGVKAISILSACLMAAPCALAVSKLLYPETEESKFKSYKNLRVEKSEHKSIIEAAFMGASQAVPLVLNIAANLIAFLSLLAMINGFLGWYGSLSGHPNLSFELICSYIFTPVSFLMGIEWFDCFKVAELLGTKIFLNEFIAYSELKPFLDRRVNGTIPKFDSQGNIQWISQRSETIVTFALCGFANLGSIGIMLGGLGGLCPERQKEMVKIIIRALIGGILVSILNACVAGFLYLPPEVNCEWLFNATAHWSLQNSVDLTRCCVYSFESNQTNYKFTESVCCNSTFPINVSSTAGCL